MSEGAIEAKNKGNAAFSKGNYEEAVKHFSQAISLDPKNHLLYSNRSAAYCYLKKYDEALEDANKTIDIEPEFVKGYSRKGAALFGKRQYDDAIQAYKQGLQLDPKNETLKSGLADVMNAKNSPGADRNDQMSDMFAKLFAGDVWTKIKSNPKTAAYLNQPDFVQIVTELQKNPSSLNKYMMDQRVMTLLGVLMGIPVSTGTPEEMAAEFGGEPEPVKEEKKEEPKKEPEPEPMKVDLTPEQEKAEAAKAKGTEAYKKKDLSTALKFYQEAKELDPDNIVYALNVAAVHLEMSDFDKCIEVCKTAIEDGRRLHADYQLIAKAYARIGNAYMKQKKYKDALEAYDQSLLEHRIASTLELYKKAERLLKEEERLAYLDPQKSLEAKERGNALFRDQKYPEAIKEYTEAIQRNPNDHTLYSNRSACYTKLGEYRMSLQDCEKCIQLNPEFVKGYTRKGHNHYFLKEYTKALEAYDEGLKRDPNNQELTDSITRTIQASNQEQMKNRSGGAPDKETLERAAQNPEVQEILSDPVMRQILDDMQRDPKAAANHLRNPMVASKVQKLVDAGILRVG